MDVVIVAGDIYDWLILFMVVIDLLDEVVSVICGELKIFLLMILGNYDGVKCLGFVVK